MAFNIIRVRLRIHLYERGIRNNSGLGTVYLIKKIDESDYLGLNGSKLHEYILCLDDGYFLCGKLKFM